MKRKQLFATAKRVFAVFAATLLFAGCEGLFPGLEEEPEGEQITITATTEKTVSRTTLNASEEVIWQEDEYITLYDMETGVNTESFHISEGAGTTNATFIGQKPDWTGASWVYYGTIAYGVYNARVPAMQAYVDGGFAKEVNPMAAVCNNLDEGVQFKNVAGIIELQISGTQELASIEVNAKEHLSGYYDLDQTTLDKSSSAYAVSEGSNVTLTDINVQLDEQKAKSFKIVVMPGTYTEFSVRMVNKDGSVVTKTADEAIVVERSKITPIAGLVDSAEPVEQPKFATISIVEDETSWHQVTVKIEKSDEVFGFLYMWGDDEFINQWMSEHQGASIVNMMIEQGEIYDQNVAFTYNTLPGDVLNFYAVGILQNEDGLYVAGDIDHLVHRSEVPYHENATLSIAVPEASITEDYAVVQITPFTSFAKVYFNCYAANVDSANSEDLIYWNVVTKGSVFENITETIEIPLGGLSPASDFVVYAVGETADGKFTHLAKQFFSTLEHVAAKVTATATIAEITEWTATLNIALSEGAVGYKVGYWAKSVVEANPDVDWAYQVSTLEGMATDETFTLVNLSESTEYVCFTLAYDANGAYGEVSRLEFATPAVTPDPNAKGYDEWLGNFQFIYYLNSDGQAVTEGGHTITISENIKGKLYNITGLYGDGGNIYGASGDDTVVARFNGEGNPIEVIWDKGVKDPAEWGQQYDIYCSLLVGKYIYLQGPQIWSNGDGTYSVGHISAPADSGYTFGAWDKATGQFVGTLPGSVFLHGNMKKVIASDASASTEKFYRQETVSPSWKSVNPLRLEKYGFTEVKGRK